MFQLKSRPRPPRRAQRGFTIIETMVVVGIVLFLLAVGIPSMSEWMMTNKAAASSEFYLDGLSLARREAVSRNAESRIVFSPNAANGQLDWQVDVCYPVPGTPCNPNSGVWSTVAAPAANDPKGASGFKSVLRSAETLPDNDVLAPTLQPEGATSIYYTPLGWVDTAVDDRVTQLRLTPSSKYASVIPTSALAISLAGMPGKCDPNVSAHDSRACPP